MSDLLSPGPTLLMNTGDAIPQVGFGVYQADHGAETQEAVKAALALGYRHIDTAQIYGNEADVGIAVRESGIPRDEIFVTSKLWNENQGYDAALRTYDETLRRMDLDYLDLFLLHWPVPELRLDSWRAMEHLVREGRLQAAGVSNFMVHHLDELLAASAMVPAINQIEVSPFLQQREVRARCVEHGIVVEAYSPLTKARRLDHPVVVEVARSLDRSPAQTLLRWAVQHDLVILPKSVRASRIEENADLFDFALDDDQMTLLDGLEEGLVTGWDPREAP